MKKIQPLVSDRDKFLTTASGKRIIKSEKFFKEELSILEQIELIEVYGCFSVPNNIKKSYQNFIVGSYGIDKGKDLKGNFECYGFNLEVLNKVANDLKRQIVNKPNNDNLPIILEVIDEILSTNIKDTCFENIRVNKFTAKEYALAYIFDLYSKGEQIPINRTDATIDAKYLKSIASDKTDSNFKGDTFYRAVKKIVREYNLNDVKDLKLISIDWKNAVLTISKNNSEIIQMLSNKKLS